MRAVPVARRGLWLRVLDATGKYCIVDTHMLIILMVALHFTLELPSTEPGAPPLVTAKVKARGPRRTQGQAARGPFHPVPLTAAGAVCCVCVCCVCVLCVCVYRL